MTIKEDKLFRLILKTDRNAVSLERYKLVLNIVVLADGKIKGRNNDVPRDVSRGRFLAMFKEENKSFMNSLENAVRSMIDRKKKRKGGGGLQKSKMSTRSNKSSQRQSAKDEERSTRLTIKSAPIATSHSFGQVQEKPNPLKRKSSEDSKTGMIITTDKDCSDEMSAVSVSPVSGADSEEGIKKHEVKPILECIQESGCKQRTILKSDSIEAILSRTQENCEKSSVKRNTGKKSSRKSKQKMSRSTPDRVTVRENRVQTTSNLSTESGHSRSNSSVESISNIREIMQASQTPRECKRLKTHHTMSQTSRPFTLPGHPPMNSSYGIHPMMNHTDHLHPSMYPLSYRQVYWMPPPSQNDNIYKDENEDIHFDCDNQNCFLLSGLASFFKWLLPSPQQNMNNLDHCNQSQECFPQYRNHNSNEGYISSNPVGPYWPYAPMVYEHTPYSDHAYHENIHSFPRKNDGEARNNNPHHDRNNNDDSNVSFCDRIQPSSFDRGESIDTYSTFGGDESYISDSLNKLEMYDYKPSIDLPEPEHIGPSKCDRRIVYEAPYNDNDVFSSYRYHNNEKMINLKKKAEKSNMKDESIEIPAKKNKEFEKKQKEGRISHTSSEDEHKRPSRGTDKRKAKQRGVAKRKSKPLLNHRPKSIDRSRIRSEGMLPKKGFGSRAPLYLTRSSSSGSTASSVFTNASDSISIRSTLSKQPGKHFHYR